MKKIKERFSGSVVNSEVVAVAKVALDDVFEKLELNIPEEDEEQNNLEDKAREEKISAFVQEEENEGDIKIDNPSDFGL